MGLGPRCLRITVVNRDYHYLSHYEKAGAKRISEHLSVPARPVQADDDLISCWDEW